MKKINISICGALGKMGVILVKKISINKKFRLISTTDSKYGSKKNINGIKIQRNSLEAFEEADIIIDFSRPKGCIEVLNYAMMLKKKIIIGTTGFNKKQENLINKYSKKIGSTKIISF